MEKLKNKVLLWIAEHIFKQEIQAVHFVYEKRIYDPELLHSVFLQRCRDEFTDTSQEFLIAIDEAIDNAKKNQTD